MNNNDDIFSELIKQNKDEFDIFLNTLKEVYENEEKYIKITHRKEELLCKTM